MPSMVAASSPAPRTASRVEQFAAGVRGPYLLGHRAVHRAGVQAPLDQEGGGAGHLVAGHHRVLHRRRPAPGGQQREVQVDPAVRRDRRRPSAAAPRTRRPGSSRARARVSRARNSWSLGSGLEDLDAGLLGALGPPGSPPGGGPARRVRRGGSPPRRPRAARRRAAPPGRVRRPRGFLRRRASLGVTSLCRERRPSLWAPARRAYAQVPGARRPAAGSRTEGAYGHSCALCICPYAPAA